MLHEQPSLRVGACACLITVAAVVLGGCSSSEQTVDGDASAVDAAAADGAIVDATADTLAVDSGSAADGAPREAGQLSETSAAVDVARAAARQWGTPILMSMGTGYKVSPEVAVGHHDDLMVVWHESWPPTGIWARRYSAGAWSEATLLSQGSGSSPEIGFDASGHATALWSDRSTSPFGAAGGIWTNRWRAGAWETPTEIYPLNGHDPQMAVAGTGEIFATWILGTGSRDPEGHVWASRRAVGAAGWEIPVRIENSLLNCHTQEIAADGLGNAIVVWLEFTEAQGVVWANRYAVGTGWEGATVLEPELGGGSHYPEVAMDSRGNALVLWSRSDGAVRTNRYRAGKGWEGAMTIAAAGDRGPGFPSLALHPSGNAMVVWAQAVGSRNDIWARRYVTEVGWETAMLVEDEETDADFPEVAVGGDGHALAVWLMGSEPQTAWASYYQPGAGWTRATPIATGNPGEYLKDGIPVPVVDTVGRATVFWVRERQDPRSIEHSLWASHLQ